MFIPVQYDIDEVFLDRTKSHITTGIASTWHEKVDTWYMQYMNQICQEISKRSCPIPGTGSKAISLSFARNGPFNLHRLSQKNFLSRMIVTQSRRLFGSQVIQALGWEHWPP